MNKIKLQGTRDGGRGTIDKMRDASCRLRENTSTPYRFTKLLPTAYCLLPTILCLLFSFQTSAQEYTNIHQNESLDRLIEKYRIYQQKVDVAEGYRIQIVYTSDRDEAYKAKAKLYKEFENAISYIEYEQPNYKLRLGDFKTRLDATAFLQEVIKLYPGAFIVKDRVKIK